jgi:hypothetical protein
MEPLCCDENSQPTWFLKWVEKKKSEQKPQKYMLYIYNEWEKLGL